GEDGERPRGSGQGAGRHVRRRKEDATNDRRHPLIPPDRRYVRRHLPPHEICDFAGTPGLPPHEICDFAGTPGLPPHEICDFAGTPGRRPRRIRTTWPPDASAGFPAAPLVLDRYRRLREKALRGGVRYLPKLRQQNKLTVRERLAILLDEGSFVEDGLFANVLAEDLPADGVVTGLGAISGRQVAVMANDPTVKAGSWGARTVEKIIRIQETSARLRVPLFYLVDSAGARITDQI